MDLVTPGTPLTARTESAALEVGATILRSLRRPAPPENPFRPLDTLATGWASDIRGRWEWRGRPFERSLLDFATGQIGELVGTASGAVVLHQDLHAGNILDAGDGRWLAIDPKPLVGDPAFDTASLLRDRRDDLCRDPAPEGRVRWRLDALADLTGLDRERMRGWGVVHALAWGLGSEVDEQLVACARWLAAAG
jgi:streptomycin 6-kinase